MRAHPSVRFFPSLWIPNRKPRVNERVRFDLGFVRELGLVGGWTFEQLTARDLSPYGRHAKPVGNTLEITGAYGSNAVLFNGDGTSDRFDLGSLTSDDPLSLAGLSHCTIAFRAYRPVALSKNLFNRVIDKSSGGSAADGWSVWNEWSFDAYTFAVASSDGPQFIYDVQNVFASLAVRMDGGGSTAEVDWFLNGTNEGSSGTDTSDVIPSTTTSAAIGNWNHTTDREWQGLLEYVYVFREALPDSIITLLQREPYRYLEPEPLAATVFLPDAPVFGSGTFQVIAQGSMTAGGDMLEMLAPDNAAIVLHSIYIEQSTEAGDAESEQLTVSLKRITGSPSSGNGGNTLIPTPRLGGYAAAAGTYEGFNTSALSGGTSVTIHNEAFNTGNGLALIWTYKTRPVISPGTRALLTLDAAPADSVTFQVTAYFTELGG